MLIKFLNINIQHISFRKRDAPVNFSRKKAVQFSRTTTPASRGMFPFSNTVILSQSFSLLITIQIQSSSQEILPQIPKQCLSPIKLFSPSAWEDYPKWSKNWLQRCAKCESENALPNLRATFVTDTQKMTAESPAHHARHIQVTVSTLLISKPRAHILRIKDTSLKSLNSEVNSGCFCRYLGKNQGHSPAYWGNAILTALPSSISCLAAGPL